MKSAKYLLILMFFAAINGFAASDDSNTKVSSDDGKVLAQKITYQAKHKAVKEILADLSKMSGLTLKAGWNNLDWQVRDRKMDIFVKDVPLATLMNSISHVMKFKWTKSETEDHSYYRLYMDRKTLLNAEAKAYQAEQKFNEEVLARRANFVQSVMDMDDNLSPEQQEQLKKDNPYLYGMYERGAIAFLKGMFKDVPETAQAIAGCERNMLFSSSQLSPETKDLLIKAVRAKWPLKGYRWTSNGEEFPEAAAANFNDGDMLGMETVPRDFSDWANNSMEQMYYFGGIGVYLGGRYCHIDFFRDPDSPLSQYCANAELTSLADDRVVGDVYNETYATGEAGRKQLEKEFDEFSFEEPKIEHEDEPWMDAKVKFEPETVLLDDILFALAKAGDLNIVSDSFKTSRNNSVIVTKGEFELKDLLEKISNGYRYNWEKKSGVLEFVNREWFKMRARQIPDEWVDDWRSRFKDRGYVSIDDYSQIAMLSKEQISENIAQDEVFGKTLMFPWEMMEKRDLLQLYAHLTPSQKQDLFTVGVNLQMVTPEQDQCVKQLLKFKKDFLNSEVAVLLFCEKANDKWYNFKIKTSDGKYNDDLALPLPVYPEIPSKTEPAKKN